MRRYARKLPRIRERVTSFLKTYLGDMTVSEYLPAIPDIMILGIDPVSGESSGGLAFFAMDGAV
jgi:hypothetical protein